MMASLKSLPTFERQDSMFSSVSCTPSRPSKFHCDLPSALFVADKLKLDIFPITWMSALGHLGKGATAQVQQSQIDIQTHYAFKRSLESAGQNDTDRYRAIITEMIVLRNATIKEHPNIVKLIGIGWDVNPARDSVWPVLIFPRASLGSLSQFLKSEEGIQASFEERIQLCREIASAISCMHACSTHVNSW